MISKIRFVVLKNIEEFLGKVLHSRLYTKYFFVNYHKGMARSFSVGRALRSAVARCYGIHCCSTGSALLPRCSNTSHLSLYLKLSVESSQQGVGHLARSVASCEGSPQRVERDKSKDDPVQTRHFGFLCLHYPIK